MADLGAALPAAVTIHDLILDLAAQEVWRAVVGSPAYEVSSLGNIRRFGSEQNLKLIWVRSYAAVDLSEHGMTSRKRVHRLVAAAFLGPAPFVDALIAHNDGSTSNNRVDNLRWASAVENQRDRDRHGTYVRGSQVFGAKLREDQIPFIRQAIARGEPYPDIAERFGVSVSTISLIKRERIWSHVA
ncbi:HNH endonuclease [Roseomonas elaeocarpi]|uniref:HNH endonuclease n=1 Tax=Roseomonas elaeocarpi TaxID=907779 RepID=A0ABV6K020_9PROT